LFFASIKIGEGAAPASLEAEAVKGLGEIVRLIVTKKLFEEVEERMAAIGSRSELNINNVIRCRNIIV
jgi:hypothetical protein